MLITNKMLFNDTGYNIVRFFYPFILLIEKQTSTFTSQSDQDIVFQAVR